MRGSEKTSEQNLRAKAAVPDVSSGLFRPFLVRIDERKQMSTPTKEEIEAAKQSSTAADTRDLDKERAGSVLFVPVPSSWFGKSWEEDMTFDEALKALESDEQKKAVELMKQIDRQLGIKAELSSGINDFPNGVCVVIVHNIKTPLSSEDLRYIAAVKGKALLEKSPDQ